MGLGSVDWHDRGELALAIIGLIMIGIRLYVRIFVPHGERRWWSYLSDLFLVISWCCFVIPLIVDLAGLQARANWLVEDSPLDYNFTHADWALLVWLAHWYYAWMLIVVIGFYGIKASVLIFYYEWIPRCLPKCWWANIILMVITFMCFLASAFMYAFWCWPISDNWVVTDPWVCWSANRAGPYFGQISLHMFSTLLIFALPLFVVYQLKCFTVRQRLQIGFMFFLGLFNIIFAAWNLGGALKNGFGPTTNFWMIISMLDATVGIFVCCCPSLRVFIVRSWAYWNPPKVVNVAIDAENERQDQQDGTDDSRPEAKDAEGIELTRMATSTSDIVQVRVESQAPHPEHSGEDTEKKDANR